MCGRELLTSGFCEILPLTLTWLRSVDDCKGNSVDCSV